MELVRAGFLEEVFIVGDISEKPCLQLGDRERREVESCVWRIAPAKPPAEGVWTLDPACQSQHLLFSLAAHTPGSHSFEF